MRGAARIGRPGGAAIFMPDHLRETFRPSSDHGGEDDSETPDGRPGRGLRYLEWTIDPDPTDTTYQVDYAIMRRDTDGSVRLHHDRHVEGLFPRQSWLDLMTGIGFEAHTVPGTGDANAFVGRRP